MTLRRWNCWEYNVQDKYKDLTVEEVRRDMRANSHDFAVLMEHWKGDFNISTLIRNANAFNAREVFYLGKKRYDRRGTVGTHHYVDLKFLGTSLDDLAKLKKEYTFVGVDNNIDRCVGMEDFHWPEKTLMIFGEEGQGISTEVLSMCDHIVSISQYGSVRSLNAGTASGIAMYDYLNKKIYI
tara:strand:+ start:770 stop:1315 length:546 start_codon:yes stop_codon:yes gene_type:complete